MNRVLRAITTDVNEYRLFIGSFTDVLSVNFNVTDGLI